MRTAFQTIAGLQHVFDEDPDSMNIRRAEELKSIVRSVLGVQEMQSRHSTLLRVRAFACARLAAHVKAVYSEKHSARDE